VLVRLTITKNKTAATRPSINSHILLYEFKIFTELERDSTLRVPVGHARHGCVEVPTELIERLGKVRAVPVRHETLEQVAKDGRVHLKHLVELPFALPGLFSLLNLLLKFILIYVSDHKLDAQVPIVLGSVDRVPGHNDPPDVINRAMRVRKPSIEDMGPWQKRQHHPPVWKASTRHVTWFALKGPALPVKLVVVRVVDATRLDVTRAPTEGGVALRTVHLVTAVNFENHSRALWAVA
jgi:hypothetical protein